MFDIIGSLRKRSVDPCVDAALSVIDWGGWHPTHVATISPWVEGMINNFRDRAFYWPEYEKHFFFDHKWKKLIGGGFSLDLDRGDGVLTVVPLAGLGWGVIAKCDLMRGPRRRLFHALVVADSSEAMICASSVAIAKKLAIVSFQRARIGNCKAPMPGISWRSLPSDLWTAIYDDPTEIAMPLESDLFAFGNKFERQAQYPRRSQLIQIQVTFDDQILEKSFSSR